MVPRWLMLVVLIHAARGQGAPCMNCSTVDGVRCQFPFYVYKGLTVEKEYHSCTLDHTDGTEDPWCATKVDAQGDVTKLFNQAGSHGTCSPSCPTAASPSPPACPFRTFQALTAKEKWTSEKIALTSRIQALERQPGCDTPTPPRGVTVAGLMVDCPAGKVFFVTGQDSGLLPCPSGVCPNRVPDDACQERGAGRVDHQEEAKPEPLGEAWERERSSLTLRVKELELEEVEAWCDTRDTRGFTVAGLVVNCPAGKVFPRTGKDSGLVSCLPGGCPRYIPEDICQKKIAGTTNILLTGGSGHRGSKVPDFLYPASSNCTPPVFPDARVEHVTFTTPSGLVASCGGKASPPAGRNESLSSCLVLEAGKWQSDPRVPDLPAGRWGATATSVPAGVIVMGGRENDDQFNIAASTSFVLRKNGSSWEEGPALPGGGAEYSCSVAVGELVFLLGGAREGEESQVRELDTSRWEWQDQAKWPQLGGRGRAVHGCAVLNSQLIVAGGEDSYGCPLDTTSMLDLGVRGAGWREGGRLKRARYFHAMVTMGAAGQEKLYALGGGNDGMVGSVEVWQEETSTWAEQQERLPEGKGYMGAVAVTEAALAGYSAICKKMEEEVLVIAGGVGPGWNSPAANVTVWPPHPSCHLPGLPGPSMSGFGSLLLDQQQQMTFLGKEPTPKGTPGPLGGHMCLTLVNKTWAGSCSQRVHRAGAMFAPTSEGVLAIGGVKHWDPEREDYLASTEIIMPSPGVRAGLRFEMKKTRRHGCLVMDGEAMVVTGGETAEGRRKLCTSSVSRFTSEPGRMGSLQWELVEGMQQARAGHACGLVRFGGKKALVVAGGFFWEPNYGVLDTTEMLVLSGHGHWTYMEPLPSPRFYSAGAVLGGSFILSGGHTPDWPDKVAEMLELELPSRSWKKLPPLEEVRAKHGMVAVPYKSIKKFCNN